jgi:3-dehydroquinate synthase
MAGLSMSEMIIHSKFKEYPVRFVDDFTIPLRDEIANGAFVIIDKTVFELYRSRFADLLPADRFLVIEANETNKTMGNCQAVIETLVARQVRRNQRLLAIGGGVIQDITAFVASILYRGIEWSFFPTTLLAQGDSCIGSKTSINLGDKKNLVGNFYPPAAIYIDTVFLDSLESDDIKSGIGEMLHFYFYADSPLVDKLVADYHRLLGERILLLKYINGSLAIKKSVIEIDEFDKGERNKFNYGHTFGHALETITDYGVKHGQAVTVGMDIANYLSVTMGLMDQNLFDEMHAKLALNFPVYDFGRCSMEAYFEALAKDKKNTGNNLGCILAEGPGRLVRRQVPFDDALKRMIRDYFDGKQYKPSLQQDK